MRRFIQMVEDVQSCWKTENAGWLSGLTCGARPAGRGFSVFVGRAKSLPLRQCPAAHGLATGQWLLRHLSGASSVWYSVIPDKSNFAPGTVKARLDHNEMISKLTPLLSDWNYIEIGNLLSLDDYLLTDGHWRQERIVPVANAIASKLGYSVSKGEFAEKSKDGFSGDYGKYSGFSEKTPGTCGSAGSMPSASAAFLLSERLNFRKNAVHRRRDFFGLSRVASGCFFTGARSRARPCSK